MCIFVCISVYTFLIIFLVLLALMKVYKLFIYLNNSKIFSAGSLVDNDIHTTGPLLLPLRSCNGQNHAEPGTRHDRTILQPSSAPTSPQHRSSFLSSPPPPLSPQLSIGFAASSDPNFHATSLRERNATMLNNELMADVHFLVGQPGKVLHLNIMRNLLSFIYNYKTCLFSYTIVEIFIYI